jgi:hypothetical protein
MSTTKEGIEVCVGQVWRDMDKRMHRVVMVIEVNGDKAVVRSGWDGSGTKSTLSIKRMHKHSTGWQLVRSEKQ